MIYNSIALLFCILYQIASARDDVANTSEDVVFNSTTLQSILQTNSPTSLQTASSTTLRTHLQVASTNILQPASSTTSPITLAIASPTTLQTILHTSLHATSHTNLTTNFDSTTFPQPGENPPIQATSAIWNHITRYFSDFKSQITALNLEYCGQSCKFQHRLNPRARNGYCDECSCTETCEETGDCCPDLTLLDNKTRHPFNPGCIAADLPSRKNGEYYLMFDRCPVSYNITILKTACENPSYTDWIDIVPHISMVMKTSFRNIYCAQCHGKNNTLRWSTSITCSLFDQTLQEVTSFSRLFNATMSSKTCFINISPPLGMDVQKCRKRVGDIIEHCNETGRWKIYDRKIEMGCSMYSQVVFGAYRNIFCYMCNLNTNWRAVLDKRVPGQFKGPMTASLTALIDFDSTFESRNRGYSENTRTDIQSYFNSSEQLKQCQKVSISCVEGKELDNDQCHSVFSSSNMYGYRICFQANITITKTLKWPRELTTLVWTYSPQINYSVIELANKTADVLEIQNCPERKMYAVVRYVLFIFSILRMNRDQLERDMMGDQLILRNSSIAIRYQGGCNNNQMRVLKMGDSSHCSMQFRGFVFRRGTAVPGYGMNIAKSARYLQLSKQLTCPRVVLNPSHYIIKYHDNINAFPRLTLLDTKTVLEDEGFLELDNGSVVVCLNDYVNATFQTHISCKDQTPQTKIILLGIFSFICTSVSLFFLAITFVTYCLFASLRTIGGVCNMALLATMFAAQVVLEIGLEQNEDFMGCQIIGIFIHFLWLAAVFWMNACTFLLFLKLSFPLKCRNFSHNLMKLFSLSSLYVYGTSALIVGLNIVVNIALYNDIGYGGNICYLNTRFSKIYFFKIPMGLIIMINIVLFVFTICRIRRNGSVNSTREGRVNLLACVKLSVITGLVWLSSYLFEIFQIEAFAYLFTLLVGSQGVLFFVAIVVNRNVLSLWSTCLVCKTISSLKVQTNPGSTTSTENLTRLSAISHTDSCELKRIHQNSRL